MASDSRKDRMRRFVEGTDRAQATLFPECLEDWICEDNPVRAIDVFVDELDLAELGLSSQIQSSRHSGNSVACARSVPSTKRLIRSSRESLARLTRNEAFLHSLGQTRSCR